MKHRKRKKLILCIIPFVIAVIMAMFFVPRIITKTQLRQQLESGDDYLLLGKLSKAKQAYKKALAIEPESTEAYLGLAEVYIEEERFEKALEQLEKGYTLTGEYALERKIRQVKKKVERQDEGLSIISPTPSPTAAPTGTAVAEITPSSTVTPVPTNRPNSTQNPTKVPSTISPIPTGKPTRTPTPTAAITGKPSSTPNPTAIPTGTADIGKQPSATPSPTVSPVPTTVPVVLEESIPEHYREAGWEAVKEGLTTKEYKYSVISDGTVYGVVITSASEGTEQLIIPEKQDDYPVLCIADGAFRDNQIIKRVELPDTVTDIGAGSFHGCSNLSNINIPKNISSIGADAFRGCTGLTTVAIYRSMINVQNVQIGEGTEASTSTGMGGLFDVLNSNYDKPITIMLSDRTVQIGENVFSGCNQLTYISLIGTNGQKTTLNIQLAMMLFGL